MSNTNSQTPKPLPFAAAQVPLVGQPFTLKGWFITVQLVCNCGAHEPVLIVGQLGGAVPCPACGKMFVLQGLAGDVATQQMNIQLGIAMRPSAKETP